MPSLTWTPARTDTLRRLWDRGLPCSRIAAELEVSRNMVIGKARRLRLAARGRSVPVAAKVSPEPAETGVVSVVNPAPASVEAPPAPGLPEPVNSGDNSVSFHDLRACHCRWIPGQADGAATIYCGAPVVRPGASWCVKHLERVAAKVEGRRRVA